MRARALCALFLFLAASAALSEQTRELAASPAPPAKLSSNATATILMVPAIFEGLIVGAVLLFFTIIGGCCIMSIGTPDVLHSQALPAGKEY